MGKPAEPETKKPYSKPTLTVYGTVRELTQMTGNTGSRDNGRVAGSTKTNI
jgi:hypothetical protein